MVAVGQEKRFQLPVSQKMSLVCLPGLKTLLRASQQLSWSSILPARACIRHPGSLMRARLPPAASITACSSSRSLLARPVIAMSSPVAQQASLSSCAICAWQCRTQVLWCCGTFGMHARLSLGHLQDAFIYQICRQAVVYQRGRRVGATWKTSAPSPAQHFEPANCSGSPTLDATAQLPSCGHWLPSSCCQVRPCHLPLVMHFAFLPSDSTICSAELQI